MDPSAGGSSTVRPRQRRLNSLTEEELRVRSPDKRKAESRLITPLDSPLQSRAASPIPSKHPSRSVSSNSISKLGAASNGRPLGGLSLGNSQTSPSLFPTGLWENSWTTLQGLASTVLGSDAAQGAKDKPNANVKPTRRKKVPDFLSFAGSSTSAEEWGPKGPQPEIGVGSKASREAQVRAKRREDLMNASGETFADSLGRFKRRGSDDRGSASAPPAEHERDALVYVHHVRPDDTLAGVSIKYNCPIPVLRKANRLWPNDTIQIKKALVLPVEACAVKGRPCQGPEDSIDLLGDGFTEQPMSENTRPDGPPVGRDPSSTVSLYPFTNKRPTSSIGTEPVEDPPWKHDSWVLLDNQSEPVEIARLPRKTLGFFPPSRRKSVSFSDLDTPSESIDLPRSPAGVGRRPRRDSASYFAAHLQGPGGVGTLDGDVISPGPAPDKLNKLFAPLAPNVAPRTSFESQTSTSSTGFDNVGSAIEGWMRKIATKAATLVEPPVTRRGELIELDETLEGPNEFGEGLLEGGGIGRGRPVETERQTHERMLNERFPPRGRMATSSSKSRRKDD